MSIPTPNFIQSLAMPTVPIGLPAFPAHSIFGKANEQQDDWLLVDAPVQGSVSGTKTSRMVLRDKHLIVANGSEIRMCSLGGESWDVEDGRVGTYKVSTPKTLLTLKSPGSEAKSNLGTQV